MKTLDDFDFKSKTVIVRIDINSPIVKKKIEFNDRFKAAILTIKELKKKKARIVLIAHQGRPGKDFTGLQQHAKILNRFVKLRFVDDIIGEKAVNAIKKLKNGEVLLLDNVRKLKHEFKTVKNNMLINKLAPLADFYVNDAFSVCHRKQASVVLFPKYLPSCAGRALEKEIKSLKQIKMFKKPSVFILGGAKPKENITLIKKYKTKITKILLAGILAQYIMMCKGFDFGAQNKYLKKLGLKKKKLILSRNTEFPVDFGVKVNGKRKNIAKEKFPVKQEIFDIGPKTQERYIRTIKKAKSIFMKGTPGYSEDRRFAQATKHILKAIEQSKAVSVVGGGHTVAAIERFKINKNKISHISLAGGALLDFMAGKKLPGLEALKNAKKRI